MFKYGSCQEAAYAGDLDELKRMHLAGLEWNELTPMRAAQNGHLECLKYAHQQGCPWDVDTTFGASVNGHLDCLQYAHENGCSWNSNTTKYAAMLGKLECLQYAHQQGCPWDENITTNAAQFNYLDCLQYAHQQGCPWDENTYLFAAENGHIDCFKYCFEHWISPQEFWNNIIFDLSKIIDKIDLDDFVWRKLIIEDIDLVHYPELQSKIDTKKLEIKKLQKLIKEELVDNVKGPIGLLPTDVITDCLFPYL